MTRKRTVGLILMIVAATIISFVIYGSKLMQSIGTFAVILTLGIVIQGVIVGIVLFIVGINLFIRGKKEKIEPTAAIAVQIVSQLPPSATPLTKHNLKKMRQLFPVPTDYRILWAEVQRFGNHPAGVVITDKALILKAPKSEIKKQNKEITEQNKGKPKKERKSKIPYIYRIIPWEYFSPGDYQFIKSEEKKVSYHIVFDENTIFHFETSELFSSLQSVQKQYTDICNRVSDLDVSAVNSAINTVCVESAIYMAKNGAANTNTGHGIIAEDLGTELDKLSGMDATVVGRNNAKNGADKLVNGTAVQCKYCKSPHDSIAACFGDDGMFRYINNNNEPMKIEVPKDQYMTAVDEMKTKIRNGKVPGVTNPDDAVQIVREGKLTYQQAVNVAKAGTFESITYDAVNASVRCLSVFGISFLFVFAQVYWETKDAEQAAKCALVTGAKIYGLSILGSVVSSQLARAGLENLFYPMMKDVLKKVPDSFIEKMAEPTQGVVKPESVVVNGSRDYYTRFLASQVSTACVIFLVFSAPDTYRVISHNISGGQFVMNMAERLAGTIGGGVTGSVVGGIVGNAVNPFVGGIVGFAAGTVGGMVSSGVTRVIVHLFREDDSVIIGRLFTAVLINTVMDYMLTQSEQEQLVRLLERDDKKLQRLRKKLFKSKAQVRDIRKYLVPKIHSITAQRDCVRLQAEAYIRRETDTIMSKGEFCYEV